MLWDITYCLLWGKYILPIPPRTSTYRNQLKPIDTDWLTWCPMFMTIHAWVKTAEVLPWHMCRSNVKKLVVEKKLKPRDEILHFYSRIMKTNPPLKTTKIISKNPFHEQCHHFMDILGNFMQFMCLSVCVTCLFFLRVFSYIHLHGVSPSPTNQQVVPTSSRPKVPQYFAPRSWSRSWLLAIHDPSSIEYLSNAKDPGAHGSGFPWDE